jgi:hypothetical protein
LQQEMQMRQAQLGMDQERFGFQREQYADERRKRDEAMTRMKQTRDYIAQNKPDLLPIFDAAPEEAMKRLFPEPRQPLVVPKGAAVMGPDGKPSFTNTEPPEQTAMEKALIAAGIDPKSPQGQQHLRAYAQKTATHAPAASMQVSYGAPFAGVGPDGREMLFQPGNRGGPPLPTGLAAPPKAGVKPTEDENRSAGLAVRMEDALRTLTVVTEKNPGAATPPVFQSMVGMVSDKAANAMTPVDRQRVEAAQLDALDAALTLATGAAYTKEQLAGLSKAYFPQIGDKEKTIEEKRARLGKVIETARIRAGSQAPNINRILDKGSASAAPQVGGTLKFDKLPSPAQFRGKTIRDDTTGDLMVSDGFSWKKKP